MEQLSHPIYPIGAHQSGIEADNAFNVCLFFSLPNFSVQTPNRASNGLSKIFSGFEMRFTLSAILAISNTESGMMQEYVYNRLQFRSVHSYMFLSFFISPSLLVSAVIFYHFSTLQNEKNLSQRIFRMHK